MGGGAPVAEQNPPSEEDPNQTRPMKNRPFKTGNKLLNASPNKQSLNEDQTAIKTKNSRHKTKSKQFKLAPKCQHKTPSEFVCLNEKCKIYPFYSASCDKNCQNKHFHSAKVTSARLKQLKTRIQNFPKINPLLFQHVQSYKQTLAKLRVVIEDFTTAELQQLQNLQKSKSSQMSQEALELKSKIQKQKFAGISGSHLAKLWKNVKIQDKDQQLQQSKYIEQKMENVQEMGKCFKEILSNFEEEQAQQQQVEQQQLEKKKVEKSYHLFKRYKLYDDMSLGKEGSWNSTLKP